MWLQRDQHLNVYIIKHYVIPIILFHIISSKNFVDGKLRKFKFCVYAMNVYAHIRLQENAKYLQYNFTESQNDIKILFCFVNGCD